MPKTRFAPAAARAAIAADEQHDDGVRILTCVDCQNSFEVSLRSQEFYYANGWDLPKRCFQCREIKRAKFARNITV
jgi:hypothetical protein